MPVWVFAVLLHLGLLMTLQPDLFFNPFAAAFKTGDGVLNLWILTRNLLWIDHTMYEFFDGRIFYPAKSTLAYSETLLFPSLVGYPLFKLSQSSVFTFNILRILAFIAGGLGMLLFVRRLTTSWGAGFIASIYWNMNAFRLDHLKHFQNEWGLFIPLFFLCVLVFRRSPSFMLAGVMILCWVAQFLSCGYFGLFLLCAFVIYIFLDVSTGYTRWLKPNYFLPLCFWALVALCILFPYILEYRNTLAEMHFKRSVQEIKMYSANLSSFLAAYPNQVLWGRLTQGFYAHEKALFLGGLPLLGIIMFLLWPKIITHTQAKIQARIYLSLTVISALCCLGPVIEWGQITLTGPYEFLYRFVPGFHNLRVPARIGIIYMFAAITVSSIVLTGAMNRLTSRKKLWLVVIAVLALAETVSFPLRLSKIRSNPVELKDWQRTMSYDENAPVLYLPIEDDPANAHRAADAMLWHLPLKNPIVNGYSGFFPEEYNSMAKDLAQDLPGAGLKYIKGLGLRFLVFDLKKIKPEILKRYRDFFSEQQDFFRVMFDSESVLVMELVYGEDAVIERIKYINQWILEKQSVLAADIKLRIIKNIPGRMADYIETTRLRNSLLREAFFEKAKLNYWAKEYSTSLSFCEAALKTEAKFLPALLYKGLSLYKLKRKKEASEALGQVLILEPDNAFARDALSKINDQS